MVTETGEVVANSLTRKLLDKDLFIKEVQICDSSQKEGIDIFNTPIEMLDGTVNFGKEGRFTENGLSQFCGMLSIPKGLLLASESKLASDIVRSQAREKGLTTLRCGINGQDIFSVMPQSVKYVSYEKLFSAMMDNIVLVHGSPLNTSAVKVFTSIDTIEIKEGDIPRIYKTGGFVIGSNTARCPIQSIRALYRVICTNGVVRLKSSSRLMTVKPADMTETTSSSLVSVLKNDVEVFTSEFRRYVEATSSASLNDLEEHGVSDDDSMVDEMRKNGVPGRYAKKSIAFRHDILGGGLNLGSLGISKVDSVWDMYNILTLLAQEAPNPAAVTRVEDSAYHWGEEMVNIN